MTARLPDETAFPGIDPDGKTCAPILPRPALWQALPADAFPAYARAPLHPIGAPRGQAILRDLRAIDFTPLDAACRDRDAPHLFSPADTAGIADAAADHLRAFAMAPSPGGDAQRLVLARDTSGVIVRRDADGSWNILPVVIQIPNTLPLACKTAALRVVMPATAPGGPAGPCLQVARSGDRSHYATSEPDHWEPPTDVLAALAKAHDAPAQEATEGGPATALPSAFGTDVLRAAEMIAAEMPDHRLELPASMPFLPWHDGAAITQADMSGIQDVLEDFVIWVAICGPSHASFSGNITAMLTLGTLPQSTQARYAAWSLVLNVPRTVKGGLRKQLRQKLLDALPVKRHALYGQTWDTLMCRFAPPDIGAHHDPRTTETISAHRRLRVMRRFGPWPG